MTKNYIIGGLIPLLLSVAGFGIFALLEKPDPPKVPPLGTDRASLLSVMPTASVQRVHALAEKSETLDISASGTVVPYREINLAAEAAGRIIAKNPEVRGGNFVKKGQVLLRIDPRDYEIDIERLTKRRDQELASLAELRLDIDNSQRLLEVVEEEFALAEAEVKRFQSLGGFSSDAELDQAKRAASQHESKVTLQNQIRAFESRISRLELAAKLAETELEQARLNLERTVVCAPVDGRIVSEQVETDSYVQRGTPLLTIEDTEKVEVAINLRMDQLYWVLDQADLSAISLSMLLKRRVTKLPQVPVKVHFNVAGRESICYEWTGVLDRYDGAGLDPQSRTVPVRILVEKPGEFLINGAPADESSKSGPPNLVRGMFVDVDIMTRPATQLLLVPKLSIKPATDSYQIWKFVADDSAFETVKAKHAPKTSAESPEDATTLISHKGTLALDEDSAVATDVADEGTENSDTRKPDIDPSQWQAGFLGVLDGIQVVGAFEEEPNSASSDAVEYWICEANQNALQPGDYVVVTPLPGIEGNGQDTIRVPQTELHVSQ
ncbi:MAG: HlyD family efflux transporter periplasmic adaptor subunit [Pirellulaceae bacterium]